LTIVALNRQFFEWRDGQLSGPDVIRRFGRSSELVGGEILEPRSESETDHGNVAAKCDDQARQGLGKSAIRYAEIRRFIERKIA
jgi:hypothetical protein